MVVRSEPDVSTHDNVSLFACHSIHGSLTIISVCELRRYWQRDQEHRRSISSADSRVARSRLHERERRSITFGFATEACPRSLSCTPPDLRVSDRPIARKFEDVRKCTGSTLGSLCRCQCLGPGCSCRRCAGHGRRHAATRARVRFSPCGGS